MSETEPEPIEDTKLQKVDPKRSGRSHMNSPPWQQDRTLAEREMAGKSQVSSLTHNNIAVLSENSGTETITGPALERSKR